MANGASDRRNQGAGGASAASSQLDPNQLAALLSVIQLLQSQGGAQSPDVGMFAQGNPATANIPMQRVGSGTLGGRPFNPNPIAMGIGGVGSILANARAAQQMSRERTQDEQRKRQVSDLVERLMEQAGGGATRERQSAKDRVGLGRGRRLPASRRDRRNA